MKNLTGQKQYSAITAGLRDPSKLTDYGLNLIFIYPIMIPKGLKVTSSVPFETLIRDFICVTFLKEIFIQNTINIVKMAGKIQPLDDGDDLFDATSTHVKTASVLNNINRNSYASGYGYEKNPNYKIDRQFTSDVQQRINEKVALITKHLKTDPKLSKLRPYTEIITLGNLINVPIIAGTKPYQVGMLSLFHILLFALAKDITLTSPENLNEICTMIQQLTPEKYWRILSDLSLVKTEEQKEEQKSQFRRRLDNFGKQVSKYTLDPIIKVHDAIMNYVKHTDDTDVFDTLILIKKELQETKLMFNFLLEPKLMQSQYNANVATQQSTQTEQFLFNNDKKHLERLFYATVNNFIDTINSNGLIPLYSIYTILKPTRTGNMQTVFEKDFVKIKKQYLDDVLFDKVEKHIQKAIELVSVLLSKSNPHELKTTLRNIKDISGLDYRETVIEFNMAYQKVDFSGVNFTWPEYLNFIKTSEMISANCDTLNAKLERLLTKFNPQLTTIMKNVKIDIIQSLDNIFNEMTSDYVANVVEPLIIFVGTEYANNRNANFDLNLTRIQQTLIPKLTSDLSSYFYFLFLNELQNAIYIMSNSAEIELETSVNEVTNSFNYTLVLPVEIIKALYSAKTSAEWKNAFRNQRDNTLKDQSQLSGEKIFNISENYVKGFIAYINKKLKIPNLIVVDGSRGEVYYKLMNTTNINKTKISSLETFIKSNTEKILQEN